MATTSTKSRTRFVLWGWRRDDAYGPGPIRLTGGTVGQCRAEQRLRDKEGHHAGWLLAIYAEGDAPTGLRLQVKEAQAKGPSMKHSKTAIPTIAEIDENETQIRITGGPLDDLGRTQFIAFWREGDRVRGQVFFTNVEQFIARERDGEHTFRIIA